jgi:predicted CopG family antitoxin
LLAVVVPTKVQVAEKTLQVLSKLKEEMGAKSYDEVIKVLISERKKVPRSMFGSNRKLNPLSEKDEAEFPEL